MSAFNLNALVRDELAQSTDPNPHAVAERVAKKIADVDLRAALEVCLPDYVRRLAASGTRCAPVTTPPTRSKRWDAAASQYIRLLTSRVHIGDGQWKFGRDCTPEDCFGAARINREMAAKNEAWAARWEALAEKMRVHRAATLADLPPDLVQEALR